MPRRKDPPFQNSHHCQWIFSQSESLWPMRSWGASEGGVTRSDQLIHPDDTCQSAITPGWPVSVSALGSPLTNQRPVYHLVTNKRPVWPSVGQWEGRAGGGDNVLMYADSQRGQVTISRSLDTSWSQDGDITICKHSTLCQKWENALYSYYFCSI